MKIGQDLFTHVTKEVIITSLCSGISNIAFQARDVSKLPEFYTSRIFYGVLGWAAAAYLAECAIRRVFLYQYGHADISKKFQYAIKASLIPVIFPNINSYDAWTLCLATMAISAVVRFIIGERILVKQWTRDNIEVNLYRHNNKLEYVGKSSAGICRGEFKDDKMIHRLGRMGVHFLPKGQISFYDKKTTDRGLVAREQNVTKEQWAVTLFSAGQSFFGHAMLAIEGIDQDGRTFTKYAHLNKEKGVELFDAQKENSELTEFQINQIAKTWMTEKALVENMLRDIESENGKLQRFYLTGSGGENCLTWAQKKLKLADIEFELSILSAIVSIPLIECRQ